MKTEHLTPINAIIFIGGVLAIVSFINWML